jgi:hypothetical protein
MARLRRLALGLFALAVISLSLAVPAAVADQMPPYGITTLTSANFQIHFASDPTSLAFLSAARANDALGFAERAYATYVAMGYAPPVDDGDGNNKIEIYIDAFAGEPLAHYSGYVTPVTPAATTTAGMIHMDVNRGVLIDSTVPNKGIDGHAIAHEVFNLFEWSIYHSTDASAMWLEESTAEWAAFQVANTLDPIPSQLGESDRSLDCIGGQCGYVPPTDTLYNAYYDRTAASGWSFFQYLSEKYGNDIVRQIWNQAAVDGVGVPATAPINEVVAGKGSTLTAAFESWINARLNGNFARKGISGVLPTPFATIQTGIAGGALPPKVVAAGHLAARYVQFKPGDPANTSVTCYGASLALNVTIPSGVASAPAVFVNVFGNTVQPLTVSGNTASITVPWSTCPTSPPMYLSLPNGTTDPLVNGNEFVVSATLTIDPKSLPTVAPPPAPVKMPGSVISVPTVDAPPSIEVFGPELIQLAADTRVLRLIVSSDGVGTLRATLGPLMLGRATLRAGHNDVRFTLSASALTALRRTAAASGFLTLAPFSPSGIVGTIVTRQVEIEPAAAQAKPAAKAKPKAKVKAKAKVKPKKKTQKKALRR